MDILAGIATVLGIVTGAWFLWDKASAVDWARFEPEEPLVAIAHPDAPAVNWPDDIEPQFPIQVRQVVAAQLPGFTLPSAADITGEWAEYGDPDTLSPFFSEGSFTGKNKHEFAFFVLGNNGKFRVVALTEHASGELVVRELMSGDESPQGMFVRRVKPGRYRPGQSAIKLGSPRTVTLKRDGINVGMFGSADSIFRWNQKKEEFDRVWMSD